MSAWSNLSGKVKAGIISGVLLALFVIPGIGLSASQPAPEPPSVLGAQIDNLPDPKAEEPVVTTKSVTETQSIPFTSKTVDTSTLPKGASKTTTAGVNGVKTLTYKIIYEDGVETDKELLSDVVTQQPIEEIVSIGTYVAPAPTPRPTPVASSSSCDPNYSGACVPIASDVDCSSGSGNGPAYVTGPVNVIGADIYDLDRDGNGLGCE